jgi:phosphatidate cytidylyltransferase
MAQEVPVDDDNTIPPDKKPKDDPAEGVRIIGAEEAAEAIERGDVARRRGDDEPKYGDRPASPPPEGPRPSLRFPLSEADPTELERPPLAGSPAGAALPHWTEPATGEVPKILPDEPKEQAPSDDLEAWSSFANQAPRWREERHDFGADDILDVSKLGDEETRVGALDESRAPVADLFSFDEPEPEPETEPPTRQIRIGGHRGTGGTGMGEGGERNLPVAVGVGVAFLVVGLLLSRAGPGTLMVLVTGVIVVAAAELFDALRRIGYQPATLLALVATGAIVLAAYWRGEAAYPLVFFLLVVFGMLWYLSAGVPEHATTNLGVTLLGVMWIGGLGGFDALLLKFDPNGVGLLWGAILPTVAYDVGGLFVGSSWGRAPLAPTVSPNKTIEGLAGGCIAAFVVAVAIVGRIHPWNDLLDSVRLGLVVAIAAPLGDLCESLLKRDLGLKDMGSLLPGHGGVVDRFDALLFVLPSVYYLARLLDLH